MRLGAGKDEDESELLEDGLKQAIQLGEGAQALDF